jgi:hypothetical protein
MKYTILLALLVALSSCSFLRTHDYWYTATKSAVTSGVPLADVPWGYCDIKCTYLEKHNPGKDFVVISFTESTFKPDFAACYVAQNNNGTVDYALWNKAATNAYYEANCGGETEDYYSLTKGANPKYKITGDILGQGIGNEINY